MSTAVARDEVALRLAVVGVARREVPVAGGKVAVARRQVTVASREVAHAAREIGRAVREPSATERGRDVVGVSVDDRLEIVLSERVIETRRARGNGLVDRFLPGIRALVSHLAMASL